MKNLAFTFLIVILAIFACKRSAPVEKMPVTTASETAYTLYNQAMNAYEDVYLALFRKLMSDALEEDPDFFMANYQLAMYFKYFQNENRFMEYGEKAVSCRSELSNAELLLKDAISKLLDNPKTDVTDIGRELVELYPDDVNSYLQLATFQVFSGDFEGQVSTMRSALDITENKGFLYNGLGYAYMNLDRNDEAAAAFDKYIELIPNHPNPYDSKGDYYMKIKDYGKAYESYMRAHEIDTLWSFDKAMKAKVISDSLENQ